MSNIQISSHPINRYPLVSILVPCFNSAKYIAETLDSILAQTYTHWECIIVDDHSTDNSVDIIKKYIQEHPNKFKLLDNPQKGACAARNVAFENSQGEYIQYLDADDLFSSDKIEKQLLALSDKPNSIAICNCWHFRSNVSEAYNTDIDFTYTTHKPDDFLINLWGGYGKTNFIAVHSYLTPRSLIKRVGNWDERLLKDQDGEFFARVILSANSIIHVSEVKTYYRRSNPKSISMQRKKVALDNNLFVTHLKESYLFSVNQTEYAKKAIATLYFLVAVDAWPSYPNLCNSALKKSKELGGTTYIPKLGGSLIELTKKTLGWKIAKAISFIAHLSLK